MPVLGVVLIVQFMRRSLKGIAVDLGASGRVALNKSGLWNDSMRKNQEKRSSVKALTDDSQEKFSDASEAGGSEYSRNLPDCACGYQIYYGRCEVSFPHQGIVRVARCEEKGIGEAALPISTVHAKNHWRNWHLGL
jgi:hypothetical protein